MSKSTDESFLARWSRLKRRPEVAANDDTRLDEPLENDESRLQATRSDTQAAGDASERRGDGVVGEEDGSVGEEEILDFSDFDFEQLDFNSDYAQFMKEGVPEEARNKALRQLWSSNPVLANMDGLDDYCEDYTDAATVPVGGIRTAYRVGKGFLSDAEIAEWESLGRPEETEVAAATDAGEPQDRSESENAGGPAAERHGEEARAGRHEAEPKDMPATEVAHTGVADAGDSGALLESAGGAGAACGAAVKREEQAALDAYEAAAECGLSRSKSASQGEQGAASRANRGADKDPAAT